MKIRKSQETEPPNRLVNAPPSNNIAAPPPAQSIPKEHNPASPKIPSLQQTTTCPNGLLSDANGNCPPTTSTNQQGGSSSNNNDPQQGHHHRAVLLVIVHLV